MNTKNRSVLNVRPSFECLYSLKLFIIVLFRLLCFLRCGKLMDSEVNSRIGPKMVKNYFNNVLFHLNGLQT